MHYNVIRGLLVVAITVILTGPVACGRGGDGAGGGGTSGEKLNPDRKCLKACLTEKVLNNRPEAQCPQCDGHAKDTATYQKCLTDSGCTDRLVTICAKECSP